jgi:hypothetical protein
MNHQLSRTRPFVLLMGLLAALVLLFVCLYTLSVQAAPEARPDRQPVQLNQGSVASHGRADSLFIENRGQFDPAVRFAFRHGWGQTWLAEDAIWITLVPGPTSQSDELAGERRTRPVEQELQAGALKLTFAGARTNPVIEPGGVQPGHFSYLKGPDPAAWVSQVPLWEQVRYRDLYPGIDLVFSASDAAEDQVLPWRLEARPGADLNAVRLQIAGPDRLEVDGGKMRLQTGIGEVRLPLLVVHGADSQVAATISQETAVSVERLGRDEFLLTTPFTTRSSGAGPAAVTAGGLFYSTYLGGSSWDWAYDLAVDGAGAVYVVGVTPSADFPTTTVLSAPRSVGRMPLWSSSIRKAAAWNMGLSWAAAAPRQRMASRWMPARSS